MATLQVPDVCTTTTTTTMDVETEELLRPLDLKRLLTNAVDQACQLKSSRITVVIANGTLPPDLLNTDDSDFLTSIAAECRNCGMATHAKTKDGAPKLRFRRRTKILGADTTYSLLQLVANIWRIESRLIIKAASKDVVFTMPLHCQNTLALALESITTDMVDLHASLANLPTFNAAGIWYLEGVKHAMQACLTYLSDLENTRILSQPIAKIEGRKPSVLQSRLFAGFAEASFVELQEAVDVRQNRFLCYYRAGPERFDLGIPLVVESRKPLLLEGGSEPDSTSETKPGSIVGADSPAISACPPASYPSSPVAEASSPLIQLPEPSSSVSLAFRRSYCRTWKITVSITPSSNDSDLIHTMLSVYHSQLSLRKRLCLTFLRLDSIEIRSFTSRSRTHPCEACDYVRLKHCTFPDEFLLDSCPYLVHDLLHPQKCCTTNMWMAFIRRLDPDSQALLFVERVCKERVILHVGIWVVGTIIAAVAWAVTARGDVQTVFTLTGYGVAAGALLMVFVGWAEQRSEERQWAGS